MPTSRSWATAPVETAKPRTVQPARSAASRTAARGKGLPVPGLPSTPGRRAGPGIEGAGEDRRRGGKKTLADASEVGLLEPQCGSGGDAAIGAMDQARMVRERGADVVEARAAPGGVAQSEGLEVRGAEGGLALGEVAGGPGDRLARPGLGVPGRQRGPGELALVRGAPERGKV